MKVFLLLMVLVSMFIQTSHSMQAVKNKLNSLKRKVMVAKVAEDIAVNEVAKVNAQAAAVEDKVKDLNWALQEIEDELVAAESRMRKLKKKVTEAEESSAESQPAHKQLENRDSVDSDHIEELEQKLSQLKHDNGRVEKELGEVFLEIESQEKIFAAEVVKRKNFENEVKDLEMEIKQVAGRLGSIDQGEGEVVSGHSNDNGRLHDLKTRYETMLARATDFEQKCKDLEDELDRKDATLQDEKTKYEKTILEYDDLISEINEMSASGRRLLSEGGRLAKLKNKLAEISIQIDEHRLREAAAVNQKDDAEIRLEKAEDEYSSIEFRIRLLQIDLTRTHKHNYALETELNNLNSMSRKALEGNGDGKLEQLAHDVKKATLQLDEIKSKESKEKHKLTVVLRQVTKVQAANSNLEDRIKVLQNTIVEVTDTLQATENNDSEGESRLDETLMYGNWKEATVRADAAERSFNVLDRNIRDTSKEIEDWKLRTKKLEDEIDAMNEYGDDYESDVELGKGNEESSSSSMTSFALLAVVSSLIGFGFGSFQQEKNAGTYETLSNEVV